MEGRTEPFLVCVWQEWPLRRIRLYGGVRPHSIAAADVVAGAAGFQCLRDGGGDEERG